MHQIGYLTVCQLLIPVYQHYLLCQSALRQGIAISGPYGPGTNHHHSPWGVSILI